MTATPHQSVGAVESLIPGTNGQAVVTRSGTAAWDAIAQADVTGLTAALAAKPTTFAALTDVTYGTPTNGQVVTYDSGTSKVKFATIGGGTASPLALDDLTDVIITSPATNDTLKYSGGHFINLPGVSSTATFHRPEDYGAVGDLVSTITGFNATSGSNAVTFSGASWGTADVGKLIIGNFGTAGTTKIARLLTCSGTAGTIGTPAGGAYTAQSTVTAGPAAFYSRDATTPTRSKDGVAFQAMFAASKISGLPMLLTPNCVYAIDVSLDASNWGGFRLQGGGGRAFISSNGAPSSGGSILAACSETAITMINGSNTAQQHNGIRVENVGAFDPTLKFVHTFVRAQYQTRWRLIENCFNFFNHGVEIQSGNKDVSWGYGIGNTWLNNATSWYMNNQVIGNGGAMANAITGGDAHVLAGQTGIDWLGGGYGEVSINKVDMDGAGCKFIILHGQASGTLGADGKPIPSANQITIHDCHVEAGTTNNLDSESVFCEILGGVSNIGIMDCYIGGGGSSANGTTCRMTGVASNQRVENVTIVGGASRARDPAIIFGAWTRNCRLSDHTFVSGSGNAGKFIRADTNSLNCRATGLVTDGTTNPLADVTKIDVGNATRFYLDDMSWATDRSMLPQFAGAPTATFGSNGDQALNTSTGKVYTKVTGTWVVSGV